MSDIGRLAERSLHAALKAWLAQPGDRVETPVGSHVIDIVRGDPDSATPPMLIEVQTGHFSALKTKLAALLPLYPLRIVHPLAIEKQITRLDADGVLIARRRSPRRGDPLDVFRELVSIPAWLGHPNLTLELIDTQQEEIWRDDGAGSWRRKGWSIADRRLVSVGGSRVLRALPDYLALLLESLGAPLPDAFTRADVEARLTGQRKRLAQPALYTLRECGALRQVGRRGRAFVYSRPAADS